MKKLLRELPIPASGLMLGLAALGNLLSPYGTSVRYTFGALSAILLILLAAKWLLFPQAFVEAFDNPVMASVMPTYSMGMMILSTYVRELIPSLAYGLWVGGAALHLFLIIVFTKKYILGFNIRKVFPSYFIVYVGIVVGSVSAPAFGLIAVGQAMFWFGFGSYLALIPVVLYRVLKVGEIPSTALPTLIILAAPGSLALAGYLNSFPQKNLGMVGFLGVLSLGFFLIALAQMPRLLRSDFSPGYSCFTFPFVITAIAMKGTYGFLSASGNAFALMAPLVRFLEIWSLAMVLYVMLRYSLFLIHGIRPVSMETMETMETETVQ